MGAPDETLSEKKLSSKHKWRGKLFSADGKFGRGAQSVESTDADIANFLGTTARPEARSQPATLDSHGDATQDARRPSIQCPQPEIVDVYRKPRPRQNKGLHVTFTTEAPEIIGEGGDEAELPAREVFRSSQHFIGSARLQAQGTSSGSGIEQLRDVQRRPLESGDEGLSRRTPLLRRPTGLDEQPLKDDSGGENGDTDTDESIHSLSPDPAFKVPPQSAHSKHDLRDDSSNGRSTGAHEDVARKSDKTGDADDRHSDQIERSRSHNTGSSPEVCSLETATGSYVDHNVSPEISSTYPKAAPSSYNLQSKVPSSRRPLNQANLDFQTPHQANSEPSAAFEAKTVSFRSIAKSIGDDSLEDFDSRVRRFNDVFQLAVSAQTDMKRVPLVQWVMTATWWFLKGRAGLETAVRASSSGSERMNPDSHEEPAGLLKQAHVNLAKSWWIVREITPNHPEIRKFGKTGMSSLLAIIKNIGDHKLAELVEVRMSVISNMRALTMSMKRNDRLPPHEFEIQRLDLQILPNNPTISPYITKLTVNNLPGAPADSGWFIARPFFPFSVGDNERHFSFCRLFVDASLESSDDAKRCQRMSCIVSVLRERNSWGLKATITSQDGQVNLVIQPNGHGNLTWKEVHWKVPSKMIHLSLSKDFGLRIQFLEKDFRSLWGIYDYTRRVQKDYSPGESEEILFEHALHNFQCDDPPNFPSGNIPDCRLRLFESKIGFSDGTGQRSIHDGYRLTVITPPGIKTLSSVNYPLGKDTPILFTYKHSKEGPNLVLSVSSSVRLSLSFRETQDRERFRSLLCGTSLAKEDYAYGSLLLRNLSITGFSADHGVTAHDENNIFKVLLWNKLRVANRALPAQAHDAMATVRAEHLRIMVECDLGTLTDRVNLGPGELQINLSVDELSEIKLLRPPQPDITWSMLDGMVPQEVVDSACQTLQKISNSKTVRTYQFASLSDLHSFQTMVTGFKVLFDGPTNNFAISRQRKGLPLHKQWEANSARLQIIEQGKVFQLVVFFKGFNHGSCMNFVLKVTDVFETFSKSGLFYLRIADAKFAMPKGEEDQTKEFVCLDMPEYPSEHDDITIRFDSDHERAKFVDALPAPVSKVSRMASLRR